MWDITSFTLAFIALIPSVMQLLYLYLRTLAALAVCTYAKPKQKNPQKTKPKQKNPPPQTPTFSPLPWCAFCEFFCLRVVDSFFPKSHKHLLSIKGTNAQQSILLKGPWHQMSTAQGTSDLMRQVLRAKQSYFTVMLFCTIYARFYFFFRTHFLTIIHLEGTSSSHLITGTQQYSLNCTLRLRQVLYVCSLCDHFSPENFTSFTTWREGCVIAQWVFHTELY